MSSPEPDRLDAPVAVVEPAPSRAEDQADIVVHVAGAVARPGVVRLSPGARAIDAIEAAGGATHDADLSGVNLAAEVLDGSQLRVPRHGDQGRTEIADDDAPLVVNQATEADLEALPGVGPVLAGRIVAHRDQHGPFSEVEDLLDVPGIGESILARLRPHIRIP